MKLANLVFLMLIFYFSSVNAEISNFEKGKNLYDTKKYDLGTVSWLDGVLALGFNL